MSYYTSAELRADADVLDKTAREQTNIAQKAHKRAVHHLRMMWIWSGVVAFNVVGTVIGFLHQNPISALNMTIVTAGMWLVVWFLPKWRKTQREIERMALTSAKSPAYLALQRRRQADLVEWDEQFKALLPPERMSVTRIGEDRYMMEYMDKRYAEEELEEIKRQRWMKY